MQTNVNIKYLDYVANETIDLPNKCPHCGNVMSPHVYSGYSSDNSNSIPRVFGILAQCTVKECGNYFSLRYAYMMDKNDSSYRSRLIPDTYRPPISVDLPEHIEKVSSDFVTIYSQATKAEKEGLDQIAGVGYRKSLEFLIKDYAKYSKPSDEETIKKMFLGKVIDTYLDDFPKLQNLAKAATWIGNDETHYIRKHDDKDIRDMKQFIKSASHFIVANYDADLAKNFISQRN